MPSARSIGVGAFVLGGVLLFSLALFLIGNRRMLFSESFVAYADFASIAGIEVGSTVRVAGMDAGEVKDIRVPSGPAGRFRLRLQLREDLHPLVRTDSVATIQTQGLVGAQFVQVGTGTAGAPRVADGGTIQSREPIDFADILAQLSDTIRQANSTIVVLRDSAEATIGTIQQTASDADTLITSISSDVSAISKSGVRILADAQALLDAVKAGKGTVGRLFVDDELYRKLAATVSDAQAAVASMRQVADQARDALAGGNGKAGLSALGPSLSQTLDKARESMTSLAEATEALKHNFLVRGFFTRRGYFRLADLSAADYRRGVLEADDRRALRLWLDARVLFTRGGDGVETLTDEGKARLDSAFGQFLEHRQDGPLVVEGYADGPDAPARYLASRNRAEQVRAYLVQRFQLDPAATGAVALGRDAVTRSPAGDRWDGVVLALFIQPDALISR